MNMFAKNKAKSVKEYLLNVPDDHKKDMVFLHDFIQKTVPTLKPHFATNMIGYGAFQYLDSKKKQVRDWPIISLANQKNYISIYVCAIVEGKNPLEEYGNELGKVSMGRTCISLKKVEDVNLKTLKTLLQIAEKNPGLVGARLVK